MIEYVIILVLIAVTSYFVLIRNKSKKPTINSQEQPINNQVNRITNDQQSEEEEEVDNTQQNLQNIQIDPNRQYTKKELHKMEKKQAKAQEREAREDYLKMRKEKKIEEERQYEEKEQKRKEEERKEEELINKLKEDKEKKELQEYENWQNKFELKEEGQSKLQFNKETFIQHITIRKIVSLEDLAGTFRMSSQEIVFKLNQLEDEGLIIGIIDDRGKYIMLTEKELANIEKNVISRGRISKQDIISFCNKAIKFTPSEEYKQQIQNESDLLISSLTENNKK